MCGTEIASRARTNRMEPIRRDPAEIRCGDREIPRFSEAPSAGRGTTPRTSGCGAGGRHARGAGSRRAGMCGGRQICRLTDSDDGEVTRAVDGGLPDSAPITDTCRTAPESPPVFTWQPPDLAVPSESPTNA